jgi:hypothetical protein
MYSTLKGHHDYVELSTQLAFLSTWADLDNLTESYLSSTLPFTLHNDVFLGSNFWTRGHRKKGWLLRNRRFKFFFH